MLTRLHKLQGNPPKPRSNSQLIVMACSRPTSLLAISLVLTLYLGCLEAQEEVTIFQGKVQGTTLITKNGRRFPAFLGIPYAEPPIGSLRFKNPLPVEPWNGTLMAVTDANQCPQFDDNAMPIGYEDCLYLNVYTPQLNPSVLYPTMVYIHGGNFVYGNSSTTTVGPDYIMDKDVVLVTMNYRLGVLGFLSTGDAEAPGNFGLKDQVVALRWVKQNIESFGGDPNRVTLFGQSAGGVSVNLHVLSDSSDGLFNQYITQSGSTLGFWAYRDIAEYKLQAIDLAEYLNCPTNNSRILIDCLRDIDVYSIVDTNDIFTGLLKLARTWLPTNEPELEGAFLTTSPIKRMLQNKMKDRPWISGNVADEGLIISALLYVNSTIYDTIAKDLDSFLLYVSEGFLAVGDAPKFASKMKHFYFKDVDPNDKKSFIQKFTDLINDAAFLFPAIVQMQIALQQMRNEFYYYSFEYRGTVSKTIELIGNNEKIGVTHTDDLIYLFPLTPEQLGYPELEISEADKQIIDIMVDFWTSFSINGIPTSNHTTDLNIWQPYNDDTSYLQIGANTDPTITHRRHFHEERMHFWAMQLLIMAI